MNHASRSYNTAIGYKSNSIFTTGSQNTAIGTGTLMYYSVLWCPTCNKTYIRHIIDASITSYICKCNNHLIKLDIDHTIVEKVLEKKGSDYLSKEDLVEILV